MTDPSAESAGPPICQFFVYGTLKRGECRAAMWPRTPQAVRPAFVRGQLFDLGPYPALWCGDATAVEGAAGDGTDWDWVEGEVWTIAAEDMAATVRRLDQIEETDQLGCTNEYDRILVRAHELPGSDASTLAFAYQYSTGQQLPDSIRVRCRSADRVARWPAGE